MAEYVMDYDGWAEGMPIGAYLKVREAMHERKRERIVRCMDCRHYDEIIHACDHPNVTPLRGDCPENWIFSCFDNDFCCWGERKEVVE
jgi:hypothetical protein